jgi:hypothetical protein
MGCADAREMGCAGGWHAMDVDGRHAVLLADCFALLAPSRRFTGPAHAPFTRAGIIKNNVSLVICRTAFHARYPDGVVRRRAGVLAVCGWLAAVWAGL